MTLRHTDRQRREKNGQADRNIDRETAGRWTDTQSLADLQITPDRQRERKTDVFTERIK
jgi:hypothetical protein